MKSLSMGTLSFGAVGFVALALVAIGPPGNRNAGSPPVPKAPPPPSVSGGGFTLASVSIDLPIDDQQYPDGPQADVINANCMSCHSASMALSQPALTADQWKATVTKMREVYKAPVAGQDIPAIVGYLTAMHGQQGRSGTTSTMAKEPATSRNGGSTG